MAKKITRRQFLKRSAAAAALGVAAPHMRFLPGTDVAYAAGPSDAIVVFVEMFGGNDGINTVYPLSGVQRSLYEGFRPTLRLPLSAADDPTADLNMSDYSGLGVVPPGSGPLSIGSDSLGDEYALHPAMKALHDLYTTNNNVAVVHGVHYPYPSHSHFRSEEIWYTGDPTGTGGLGWLGRYLTLAGFGATEVPGVVIDNSVNPLFTPTQTSIFAFNRLSDLKFPAQHEATLIQAKFRDLYNISDNSDPGIFPELVKIGQTGIATVDKMQEYYLPGKTPAGTLNNAGKVEALLLDANGSYNRNNELVYNSPLNPSDNPGVSGLKLMRDIRHVAATIRANVGARFFHVGIGGFDSHSNQEQGFFHSTLLYTVAQAAAQLYNEMNQTVALPAEYSGQGYLTGNLASKLVIVTLSEFGRTIRQNALSAGVAGTDHGAASPQFVIGDAVLGGQYGAHPQFADPRPSNDDDLRMTHDFRDLYGTILERWLNVNNANVQPGGGLFEATPIPDAEGNSYTAYTPIPFLAL